MRARSRRIRRTCRRFSAWRICTLAAIAAKVPDCGYQLRRVEVEAAGSLEEHAFVFASNGLRVTLDEAAAVRGVGRVTGSFEAPIGDPPQFTVEAFEATPAR